MSIYRTGNSPFWHVRIYDNLRKRYIVRSSKEKARLTAKEVAEELFDEHRSKKNQAVAVSRDTSFRHYAEKLQAHEKAMAARMRGKRFFTEARLSMFMMLKVDKSPAHMSAEIRVSGLGGYHLVAFQKTTIFQCFEW